MEADPINHDVVHGLMRLHCKYISRAGGPYGLLVNKIKSCQENVNVGLSLVVGTSIVYVRLHCAKHVTPAISPRFG